MMITAGTNFLHATREPRVAINRYLRWLLTSEDHNCTNSGMQKQSTNMTVLRGRVTSQVYGGDVTMVSQKGPSLVTMA